ncbi:hypothetical protein QQ045_024323 [Rhodiola kirilowii]
MAEAPASPGGGRSHESGGDQSPRSSNAREQDRFLPIANIRRIMKKALPANGKIAKDAKDAKETVQECVSEFISFVTSDTESLLFDFGTIKSATNNFSDDNKLGQGGFGSVYKGKLADGIEISVKRLANGSGQGDIEFKNEVQYYLAWSNRHNIDADVLYKYGFGWEHNLV